MDGSAPHAVVLSIGSEILRGDILDRNAAFLTFRLSRLGVEVERVEQIGDDLDRLTDAFSNAIRDAGFVICTGGLGPTADDLTRQAIAGALGEELYLDTELLGGIRARFAAMGRAMPESNDRQAMLIASAEAIANPRGTAPGWYVTRGATTVIAMPGPPYEMEPMWIERAEPRLLEGLSGHRSMLGLMTFGIGESALEERIEDLILQRPDVTIATYAKSNGVQVHVTARSSDADQARALRDETESRLRERLGPDVFGVDDETLAQVVGRMLQSAGMTLATMESATGGQLASLITDVDGSSDYFTGGVVAYTRAAKRNHGVPDHVMDAHGLISPQTALAMARAARDEFASHVGIGTTGVAGTAAVEDHPPGTVFIGLSMEGRDITREIRRPGDRTAVKAFASQSALDLLRRQLRKEDNG